MSLFNRHMVAGVLLTALTSHSMWALAADGNVNFQGKISTPTCGISNGSGGDLPVTLPEVTTGHLSAANAKAGLTNFSLAFTPDTGGTGKCPAGSKLFVTFDKSSPLVNKTTGYLNPAAGGATGVQVQLLSSNSTPLNLNNSTASETIVLGTKNQIDFKAQYIAPTGQVVAGTVNTSVGYIISYP